MSSPIHDQMTQLANVQKKCREVLGELKGRKVTPLNSNSYLRDVMMQMEKLQKTMKATLTKDESIPAKELNQQLDEVKHKIEELQGLYDHAQKAKNKLDDEGSDFILEEIGLIKGEMEAVSEPAWVHQLEARLNDLKSSNPEAYRDELYAAINNRDLSKSRVLTLVKDHVIKLAYQDSEEDEPTLNRNRGEIRFETWLAKWLTKPDNGKQFIIMIGSGKVPPYSEPLASIVDRELLLACRKLQPGTQLSAKQLQDLEAMVIYVDLRSIDEEFKDSPLADECVIRLTQLMPEAKEGILERLMKFDDPENSDEEDDSIVELFKRSRLIEGLSLDPDYQFMDFLIHCTVEDLHSVKFDKQLETFAEKTAFPSKIHNYLSELLPLYLVPHGLREQLRGRPTEPNESGYPLPLVNTDQIRVSPFREGVLVRIEQLLSTNFRTPLQLLVAIFVIRNAQELGLNAQENLLQRAHRITNSGTGLGMRKSV